MQPPGGLSEVVQHAVKAFGDRFDVHPEGLRSWRCCRLQCAQLHRQGDEPLLRTVVEIPLDPSARLIGGRDDAGP